MIASDSDFSSCRCVVSGSGTTADPYVIGLWSINNVNGVAVSIDGTNLTKSFRLSNLTIAGNATPSDTGIVLNHINTGGTQIGAQVMGAQTSIQTNNVGILVENSTNVVLDGGGSRPREQIIVRAGGSSTSRPLCRGKPGGKGRAHLDASNAPWTVVDVGWTSTEQSGVTPERKRRLSREKAEAL